MHGFVTMTPNGGFPSVFPLRKAPKRVLRETHTHTHTHAHKLHRSSPHRGERIAQEVGTELEEARRHHLPPKGPGEIPRQRQTWRAQVPSSGYLSHRHEHGTIRLVMCCYTNLYGTQKGFPEIHVPFVGEWPVV